MINYSIIPKSIMDKSISLKELGILEHAWYVGDIKKVIDILDIKKIPILGGDVYKIIDGKIYPTYDSWYINKSTENDFYKISHEKTTAYILSYEERNEGHFLYTFVF